MRVITDGPLVSIGLPVYNSEASLPAALDSLLSQSYSHLEVVLCDNASTDGTGAVCREYAARDPRVRHFRNDENIGVLRNFRRVLKEARGDYFAWMGGDDVRPPGSIARLAAALDGNERAVMAHGPILLNIEGRTDRVEMRNEIDLSAPDPAARVRAFTAGIEYNAMLFGMYRREVLARAVFGLHYGQDYLMCLQMCMRGPIVYVDEPMILFRHRAYLPVINPMHTVEPLNLRDLLVYRGPRRNKCWTVLPLGCYYALVCRELPRADRLRCMRAHVSAFLRRYHGELLSELPYLLFTPAAWLAAPLVPPARRVKATLKSRRAFGV